MLNDDKDKVDNNAKSSTTDVLIKVMQALQVNNKAMSATELADYLSDSNITRGQILGLQTRVLKGKEHQLMVVADTNSKHYKLSISRAVDSLSADIDTYFDFIKKSIEFDSNSLCSEDKRLTDGDKKNIYAKLNDNVTKLKHLLV